MNTEWIDRYVCEVVRHLSAAQRKDVSRELRFSILDELDERFEQGATEENVIALLQELGPPRAMAASYRPSNQYLLGPTWFPIFRRTLKIVLTAQVGLFVLATALVLMMGAANGGPGAAILSFLGTLFDAIVISFGLLLLIFYGLERGEVALPARKKDWDARTLPPPAGPKDLVGRGEAFLQIVIPAVFLALLYLFRELLGLALVPGEPPLLADVINRFLPPLTVAILLEMALYAYLLWDGRWRWQTRLMSFLCDAFGLTILTFGAVTIAKRAEALIAAGLPEAFVHGVVTPIAFSFPAILALVMLFEHGRLALRVFLGHKPVLA